MNKIKLLPLVAALLMLCGCAAPSAPQTIDIAPVAPAEAEQTPIEGGVITAQGDGMTAALVNVEYPAPLGAEAGSPALDANQLNALRGFCANSTALLMGEGTEENGLYSPISLYFALGMLAECTAGETQAQLMRALNINGSLEDWEHSVAELYALLNVSSDTGKCALYDSLWLSDGYTFNAEPLSRMARFMYAESFSTDFYGEAYADDISAWVAGRTERMLGLDAAQFAVSPDTAMLLFNTVYFTAEWKNAFDAANTGEDDFACADGSVATCEFMSGSFDGAYAATDAYTAAELDLKAGKVRFILPGMETSVSDILGDAALFSEAALNDLDGSGTVDWMLPKLDNSVSQDLGDLIADLGAIDALDAEKADFSALSEGLFVSNALQECRVSMDENGVVAAAFTRMEAAAGDPDAQPVEMYLNKPYIYVISLSGVPLFVGVVNSADMEG